MSKQLEIGLVSLLSGVANVYPRLPQGVTLPAITYQREYTSRVSSIDGGNTGPTEAGIQVDCIADTMEDAKDTADAVRAILHGYIGAWGTLTAHFVTLETENDFFNQDGDDVNHWVTQRYAIWTNMD